MTIVDLKDKLVSANVPPEWYCLTGGLPNEAYCIEKVEDGWRVYYSERGVRRDPKTFDTEADACENLIARAGKYFSISV